MSTVGHDPTHPNGLKEDADIATGHPQEESTMTVPNTDRPSSVTPHAEDYVSDNGVTEHASVAPDVQPMPQTVPSHPEIQPKLDHEDAANTTGSAHRSESDGTEDEEDGDEDDGDDNEKDGDGEYEDEDEDEDEEYDDEDEDEDEDEEPALKYERFSGAFQDLLKKDSSSALVVSNTHLVRCYFHAMVCANVAM
jgi:hypothetical protein